LAKKIKEQTEPTTAEQTVPEEPAAVVPEVDEESVETVAEETEETPQEASAEPVTETEQEAPAQGCTLTAEEFKQLQEHIAALRKEKDEAVSLLQRNQADFDNFRRRNQSVRKDSFDEGKRECISELLPVLDNFDRAFETGGTDEAWRDGVKLVFRQLTDILKKLGLSEIETSGKFDPNLHNAVAQEKAEGSESGDITAVFQKGYRVGDRIVRHSMVKVAE